MQASPQITHAWTAPSKSSILNLTESAQIVALSATNAPMRTLVSPANPPSPQNKASVPHVTPALFTVKMVHARSATIVVRLVLSLASVSHVRKGKAEILKILNYVLPAQVGNSWPIIHAKAAQLIVSIVTVRLSATSVRRHGIWMHWEHVCSVWQRKTSSLTSLMRRYVRIARTWILKRFWRKSRTMALYRRWGLLISQRNLTELPIRSLLSTRRLTQDSCA